VLQSLAWTTMLAKNLRTASVSEAVGRTFDGEHPCALCKNIAKSKKAEKKSDLPPEFKKFEFSFSPSTFLFTPPSIFHKVHVVDAASDALTHAPPTPPPRRFLG
jgi:hypothetical protein